MKTPNTKVALAALAALAGVALMSVPASAQQGIPGYASDGSVVELPYSGQQQLRERPVGVVAAHHQLRHQLRSDIPGYGPDGAVTDIK